MRLSQLIVLARTDTISDAWIKGIRKGWKDWINRGKQLRTWETLVSHYQEGLAWLARLGDDLMFNKGMFAVESDPQKRKKHPSIAKRWKLKVMEHLDKTREMLEDQIRFTRHQIEVTTPDSQEYKLDGGRWMEIVKEKWGDLDKWQAAAVPESYNRDVKPIDNEISNKLLRLFSTIIKDFSSDIEWGTLEREFSIGNLKVIMDDLPAKPLRLPPDRVKKLRDPNFFRGYQKYIQKAMNMLKQKKLGFLWYGEVRVKPKGTYGPNPRGEKFGVGGWYNTGQDRVYIEEDPSPGITELMAHELGHRYYYRFMSPADRAEFSSLFGDVPAVTEYGGTVSAEDFAEVFEWYVMNKNLTRDQLERFKKYLGRKRGGRRASVKEKMEDWYQTYEDALDSSENDEAAKETEDWYGDYFDVGGSVIAAMLRRASGQRRP